jgi:hypothetical protein
MKLSLQITESAHEYGILRGSIEDIFGTPRDYGTNDITESMLIDEVKELDQALIGELLTNCILTIEI